MTAAIYCTALPHRDPACRPFAARIAIGQSLAGPTSAAPDLP